MRAVGDVPEPPVSPPVMGAPPRVPVGAPVEEPRPFGVEELKTLPLQALLVRSGAITIEQLSEALRVNVATGQSVEEVAIERGWVSAEHVAQLVAAKEAVAPPPLPAPPTAPPSFAPVAPAPVAVEPVPAAPPAQPVHPAAAVEAAFTPEASHAAPAPTAAPPSGAAAQSAVTERSSEAEKSVGVFLNLTDGQRVWVGRFASEADAERRAQEVIQAFVRPEPGVWPRFSGRFIRPEAVVSVELSRRRED